MRRIKSRTHLVLYAVFMGGLISVVLGQSALAIENRSMVITHCRKLNLQNIFFYNRISSQSETSSIAEKANKFDLPDYCNSLLSKTTKEQIRQVEMLGSTTEIQGEIIRLYADAFSSLESSESARQRNLILSLLIVNVFVLSMESLLLYSEG